MADLPEQHALTESDRAAAQRLLDQVREEPGERTWRKVTSLLDLFGLYRFTPAVRRRMEAALAQAGLEVDPRLTEAKRYATVRVSTRDSGPPEAEAAAPEGWIAATEWRPGAAPAPLDVGRLGDAQGVVWIDLDVLEADARPVFELLAPVLGDGLKLEMIEDLLEADTRPKIVRHDAEGVRMVSAFHVVAEERRSDAEDPDASKAGTLVFHVIEFLAGDGWLVTCRHKGRRYRGGHEVEETDPIPIEPLSREVSARWREDRSSSAGDLGVLVLRELATTYRPAHRAMYSWLESWELDFDERADATERSTLTEVRGLLSVMRVRLTALDQSDQDPDRAWFDRVTDKRSAAELSRLVIRALRHLRELGEILRTSLELVTTTSTAKQLVLAQEQKRQGERLEEILTTVTAVLLVPTLVVGMYGANTKVPARDTWEGLALMLFLAALSGLATLLVLRRLRRAEEGEKEGEAEPRR